MKKECRTCVQKVPNICSKLKNLHIIEDKFEKCPRSVKEALVSDTSVAVSNTGTAS